MESEKQYIVEKWYRNRIVFDTKEEAEKSKKLHEKDKDFKDIKIFEVEKSFKEL